jgi:hypothetical protein
VNIIQIVGYKDSEDQVSYVNKREMEISYKGIKVGIVNNNAVYTRYPTTAGGGVKKLKRTDERFGKLVVYVGPRGGKYIKNIKKKGEYISLRTLVNKKKK